MSLLTNKFVPISCAVILMMIPFMIIGFVFAYIAKEAGERVCNHPTLIKIVLTGTSQETVESICESSEQKEKEEQIASTGGGWIPSITNSIPRGEHQLSGNFVELSSLGIPTRGMKPSGGNDEPVVDVRCGTAAKEVWNIAYQMTPNKADLAVTGAYDPKLNIHSSDAHKRGYGIDLGDKDPNGSNPNGMSSISTQVLHELIRSGWASSGSFNHWAAKDRYPGHLHIELNCKGGVPKYKFADACTSDIQNAIFEIAAGYQNIPYGRGSQVDSVYIDHCGRKSSDPPPHLDCSGFASRVYWNAGLLPEGTCYDTLNITNSKYLIEISADQVKSGDIIISGVIGNKKTDDAHVVIYKSGDVNETFITWQSGGTDSGGGGVREVARNKRIGQRYFRAIKCSEYSGELSIEPEQVTSSQQKYLP